MRKIITLLTVITLCISCNRIKPEKRVLITSEKDSVLVVAIPKAGCHNCQKVVEGGLVDEKGVKQTILNLHTKQVSIVYSPDKTNPEVLKNKVTKLAGQIPCK